MAFELDEIDANILAELRTDGRLSIRQVARNLLISEANAHSRLRRLIDAGVITGFKAKLDHVKSGCSSSAFVLFRLAQASWRQVQEAVLSIPEVKHLALISGDFDAVVLVRAKDNDDLRQVVFSELRAIPHIDGVRVSVIFEEHESN